MVPRTDPRRRPRETVPPQRSFLDPKVVPRRPILGPTGPKMGPKIEKMQWKKTSENRSRKSVENHGKMVRELLPHAWSNRHVYIAFRKRHER